MTQTRDSILALLISGAVIGICAVPVAAQDVVRRAVRVVDPVELSGPPKKPSDISATERALYQSSVIKEIFTDDQATMAKGVLDLGPFIQREPTNPSLYFLRAMVACQVASINKSAVLNDLAQSLKLRVPGKKYSDSVRDHYVLKAKVEFDLRRYADAMNDLETAIKQDYDNAADVFNNGAVKAAEKPARPCTWAKADVDTLTRMFPKDYRTALYSGLYLMEFTRFDLDANFDPILKAFQHAAELNSSSPLPWYFTADPYVVGSIGGLLSNKSSVCIDDVVPRTANCLALDETHRTGVRYLTRAIAVDPTFEPAYHLRATALFQLRESRQAIRDFNKVLELNPNANVYNDRALAEMDVAQYQAAIQDYTKAIVRGCDTSFCYSYENRANAYLKVKDYAHAVNDIGQTIRNFLEGTVYGFHIEQFRRIYPEYDDVSDGVLCEKLRVLFLPDMTYADYSKQFLVNAKEVDDFVLPQLFLKRGDAYADSGDIVRANREYDRVSNGYPKWAKNEFSIQPDGKRIRIRN